MGLDENYRYERRWDRDLRFLTRPTQLHRLAQDRWRGGISSSSSNNSIHPYPRLVVPLLYIKLLAGDCVLWVGGVESKGGQTVQLIAQFRSKGSIIVLCGCDRGKKQGRFWGRGLRRRVSDRVVLCRRDLTKV
jgi:hypothetical protein